jgi:hypothetical protein
VLLSLAARFVVGGRLERDARAHAQLADSGHEHHSAGRSIAWRERLRSVEAWSDVAHNFRADWQMVWREVAVGFVLAGFVAQLGNPFFAHLFVVHAPRPLPTLENAAIGPLIAVVSFVCSVGNVPLAAVLWSGGIGFAGVLAFLFADLIVLPIVAIYRRYYGTAFAIRITALMFVAMVLAGLAVDGLFSAAGLVPHGPRPSRAAVFGSVRLDYTLVLDIIATGVFGALVVLTMRRGAVDPVCGMSVDRAGAPTLDHAGRRYHFCSEHCRSRFAADPEAHVRRSRR